MAGPRAASPFGQVWSATYNPSSGTMPAWTNLTANRVSNDTSAMNVNGMDISSIYIDPHDPTGKTVYVTVEGMPSLTQAAQAIYGSSDGGATWANLTDNLPLAPASSVVVDPQSASTVYVATDAGVYFTSQVGSCAQASSDCWTFFGSGLPAAPVVSLIALPATDTQQVLIAGTYGRGIWQTPLWSSGVSLTSATASPDSLTFAGQAFGTTSAAQPVTLKNTGSIALTPTAISFSGDFTETTDTCKGATIEPGNSCTIQVAFRPAASGSLSGQMTISANVYGGRLTVDLSGTGTLPAVSRSPPPRSILAASPSAPPPPASPSPPATAARLCPSRASPSAPRFRLPATPAAPPAWPRTQPARSRSSRAHRPGIRIGNADAHRRSRHADRRVERDRRSSCHRQPAHLPACLSRHAGRPALGAADSLPGQYRRHSH